MKRSALGLFVLCIVFALAACKGEPNIGQRNTSQSVEDKPNSNQNPAAEDKPNSNQNQAAEDKPNSNQNPAIEGKSNTNPQGRDHLVEMHTDATADISNIYGDPHTATLRVDEVIRGEDALNFINEKMAEDNSVMRAAEPQEEDEEYLIIKMTFTLVAYEKGEELKPSRIRVHNSDFEGYPILIAASFYKGTDFRDITDQVVRIGETVTAYKIFQVNKSDSQPVMCYESMLQDGSDGLWFKLY